MQTISPEEFKTIYQKILRYILKDSQIRPSKTPRAYILGGQPGAGKSRLNKKFQIQHQGNIIIINADQYRKYHPHYQEIQENKTLDIAKYTSKFSSQITENLIEDLSTRHYNLSIEGTLRTYKVPLDTCKHLKGKGYTVELDIMATKGKISYLSTILRYYKALKYSQGARATTKEHHDKVLENISHNLDIIYEEKLFDQINIYNRQLKQIYNLTNPKTPGEVLKEFYNAKYTQKEKQDLEDIVQKLNQITKENYNNYL